LFFAAVVASVVVDFSSMPVYARTHEFHVVIDAGHGGRDRGASSRCGVSESDINLSIARFLERELVARGIGVTMTRTDQNSLANPFARNQKRSDMEARQKIIERVQPDLVVSIHLNSLPSSPGVRGLQVFYDKTSAEESRVFAQSIQKYFNETNLNVNRTALGGDFFILNCTRFPGVLIECGFLSNAQDVKLLVTESYQKMVAQNIAQAIETC
jgi:N-acetylmuramoyl-L-alanine amidase